MKYMIRLYDNADMREIFSSRSDVQPRAGHLLPRRTGVAIRDRSEP